MSTTTAPVESVTQASYPERESTAGQPEEILAVEEPANTQVSDESRYPHGPKLYMAMASVLMLTVIRGLVSVPSFHTDHSRLLTLRITRI